jgi:DNA polymerase I-like protein with 3'-5' exonuclease and polymerase domains
MKAPSVKGSPTSESAAASIGDTRQATDMVMPARRRDLQGATHFARYPFKEVKGVAGGNYYCVTTVDEFDRFFADAMRKRHLAVDTETTGLNWVRALICGFVIGWGPEHNFYLPVRHTTGDKQLPLSYVVPKMRELLGRTDTSKFFWNAKYDLHMLGRDGIKVGGVVHDGVTLSFLVDENSDHSLKGLSKLHIDKDTALLEKGVDVFRTDEAKRRRAEFSALVKSKIADLKKDPVTVDAVNEEVAMLKAEGKRGSVAVELRKHAKVILRDHKYANAKKKDVTYADIPLSILFPYACADTHYTWVLCKKFLSQVAADPDLRALYKTESRLAKVLFEVEEHGLKIDVDYLRSAGPKLAGEISDFAKKIHSDVGRDFNIDSDAELIKAFQEKGVKLTKLTKKSQELQQKGAPIEDLKYSVDAEVLEGLASKYAFAKTVLEYRGAQKLRGTYVEGILDLVDDSGFVHTNFNQNVSTGRMSCVAAWTPIKTKRGMVPIECVKVGDEVWTHKMRWRPVTACWLKGIERMYTLKFSNGDVLTCTSAHELLTSDLRWVTVGEVVNERFQKLDKQERKSRRRTEAVQIFRTLYGVGDSEDSQHDIPQCFARNKQAFTKEGEAGSQGFAVLSVEDGCQESYEGKNGHFSPSVERPVRRRVWVSDVPVQRTADVRTSSCDDGGSGFVGASESPIGASYRWGSSQQRDGQFGSSYEKGPQHYTFYAGEGLPVVEIEEIHACGSLQVHDITVAEDSSYYSCGVFSHNSNKPNIQNIPGRDRTIRRAFVTPSDEYVFVFIDYSQVELRLTAHYSQDPSLIACYPFEGDGVDVHTLTTSEVVMDLPYDVVIEMKGDKDGHEDANPVCGCNACMVKFFRGIAKRVNFGIIYGAGAGAIQRQVTSPERPVSLNECKMYIDKYFAKYLNVKRWIAATSKYVKANGQVQNAFGRYRRFPNFNKLEYWQQGRCERQAVNFLIQGTAADLFKEAIVRVREILIGKKTKIVNFVHDEMQFYWHKSELGLLKEVKQVMEDFDFDVPIVAEVAYSKTDWASKKELGE